MSIVPESAALLRIMIASPSDLTAERDIVEAVISQWNVLNSGKQQTVLLPLRWEYSAVPRTGTGDGQQVLNRDLVARAHVLLTLFGHRLGTATARAVSGTVEEINEAVERGLPVHVLFSRMPIAHDVNLAQLEGVRKIESELRATGLVGEFHSHEALRDLVMRCLVDDVERLLGGTSSVRAPVSGAILRASLAHRQRGATVRVQNEGDVKVLDLRLSARDAANGRPVAFTDEISSVSLAPGEAFQYHTRSKLSDTRPLEIDLTWREGRANRSQTLRLPQ